MALAALERAPVRIREVGEDMVDVGQILMWGKGGGREMR